MNTPTREKYPDMAFKEGPNGPSAVAAWATLVVIIVLGGCAGSASIGARGVFLMLLATIASLALAAYMSLERYGTWAVLGLLYSVIAAWLVCMASGVWAWGRWLGVW